MSPDMRFQVAQLSKGHSANGTGVRPFSGMPPLMDAEGGQMWKDLSTCGTCMTVFPTGLYVFMHPLVKFKVL